MIKPRAMIESPQTAPSSATTMSPGPRVEPSCDTTRLRLFACAAGPLWVYAVYYLGSLWFANADYSYGWLMPVLCGALFYERWQRRPPAAGPEAKAGPVLLGVCLTFGIAVGALLVQVVPGWRSAAWAMGLSLVLASVAGLHLAGGQPWVRHFAFPLVFFLIAIPWPGRFEIPLIDGLSRLNATISAVVANILGSPAIREGVTIRVGAGLVGVDEACSGIRSFQASVMVSLFLGELFRFGLARRLFFLFCGVCIAMVCNVVRTTYLVRICDLRGLDALNVNHDAAGFVILGVTMAALLVLAWIFSRVAPGAKSGPARGDGERDALSAEEATDVDASFGVRPLHGVAPAQGALYSLGACACLIFVGAELGAAWWFGPSEKQPATATAAAWEINNAWLAAQPAFTNQVITPNVASMLRYDQGMHATWSDETGRAWQLFRFKWNSASTHYKSTLSSVHARGHAPEACLSYLGVPLVSSGGRKVSELGGRPCLTEFQAFDYRGHPMHVYSIYAEVPASTLRVMPTGEPGVRLGLSMALDALRHRDRGRAEKHVMKCALWGAANDAEAVELLERMFAAVLKGA